MSSGKPDIKIFQLGLGSEAGTLPFHFDPEHPSMARIPAHGETITDEIPVETVDGFCKRHGIDQIDLLKIDVEGHELPVLQGAEGMLSQAQIHIIRVEAGVDPDVPYHTQLASICDHLFPLGYRLFGFYDQNEFPPEPANAKLRRVDAAFISAKSSTGRSRFVPAKERSRRSSGCAIRLAGS